MTPSDQEKPKASPDPDPYANTDRDDATTGISHQRKAGQNGLADEDTPQWAPPEHQPEPRPDEERPEPRPVDPVLRKDNPTQSNTNSPA